MNFAAPETGLKPQEILNAPLVQNIRNKAQLFKVIKMVGLFSVRNFFLLVR
jgi:hypothetical protein